MSVEMPTANHLMVLILAAVAQKEAKRISHRTKAALGAAKARGTKLGGLRMASEAFAALASKGQTMGAAVRTAKAAKFRDDVQPVIAEIMEGGVTSLRQIAVELNERGERALRGGEWSSVQVQRVLGKGTTIQARRPARFAAQSTAEAV